MGKLILLPNLLGEEGMHLLPPAVAEAAVQLDGLIGENERAARRFLSHFKTKKPVRDIPIALFDQDLEFLLEPVEKGETWGVISDAGLPCLADPGCYLVARARQKGIPVEGICGPSSLVLALMLCGLPTQKFRFLGYLERDRSVKELEIGETVVFIETPYRNGATLEALLKNLQPRTQLGVAVDLTQPTQEVITGTIEEWRKRELPNLDKRPAIFLVWSPISKEKILPQDSPRRYKGAPKPRGRR
ncbi:MAG: SAM-dependent methyltransferase [Verrucomicrobia bacterium]|nr:SAM-dependent methyltransferase [Verrucomicrobiota bacterium]